MGPGEGTEEQKVLAAPEVEVALPKFTELALEAMAGVLIQPRGCQHVRCPGFHLQTGRILSWLPSK